MMEQLLGLQVPGYMRCPLYVLCGWQTPDRSHPGHVVVLDTEASEQSADGRLVTRHVDAVGLMNRELGEHLAADHLDHLRALLSLASGGTGELQLLNVNLHLSAEVVRSAPEAVPLAHAVQSLRRQLVRELELRHLRPLDPWPAVQVRRLVWGSYYGSSPNGDTPAGMRELHPDDPRPPDLYQLTLTTRAQHDPRTVELDPS